MRATRLPGTVETTASVPLFGVGANRRLEFEWAAWFEGFCGFALVLDVPRKRG
jgi:hypothetical protein